MLLSMRMLSALVNEFCTLADPSRVQWDVLSPDAINGQKYARDSTNQRTRIFVQVI